MSKEKFEFIAKFLDHPKLSVGQRDDIVKLAVREIQSETSQDQEILTRLEKLESILAGNKISSLDIDQPLTPGSVVSGYLDSIGLSRLLIAYNQDPVLKCTCHLMDEDEIIRINEVCKVKSFDLKAFQALAVERFQQLAKKYKINKTIYALIRAYLSGGEPWSQDAIKYSWFGSELREWAEANPGQVPNPDSSLANQDGFELPEPFTLSNKRQRINSFSGVVLHFKYMFHIRAGNSLKSILSQYNILKGWNSKIIFEIDNTNFPENIELFTDVDKLVQAYEKILKMIHDAGKLNSSEMPIVRLMFRNTLNEVIFNIHHVNSAYQKTISDTISRPGTLEQSLIDLQINGLCDLYLVADFGNQQFAEINLWNGKKRSPRLIPPTKGVEFKLIFRK